MVKGEQAMGKIKTNLYELGEFERIWETLGMWQKIAFLQDIKKANIDIKDFAKKK